MKSNLLIAGMLVASSAARATTPVKPDICESLANYAAQVMLLNFADGTWTDPVNPAALNLKRNFAKYPITKVTDLGSCDDPKSKLPPSWCQVAGGVPDVVQYQVSENDGKFGTYPVANVVVTYNRGGCHIDQVSVP